MTRTSATRRVSVSLDPDTDTALRAYSDPDGPSVQLLTQLTGQATTPDSEALLIRMLARLGMAAVADAQLAQDYAALAEEWNEPERAAERQADARTFTDRAQW